MAAIRILIVGDGKIGHRLAESLVSEGHEIVIIDRSREALGKSEDALDALCIQGNGANIPTLIEADAKRADIVVAATGSDETNMVCCLIAKRLGSKFAIARIRDPEYSESLYLIKRELLIDLAVNPERTTALEISRLLRYPFASKVEIFARGRVEMVEFRAQEGDYVVGKPLRLITQHASSVGCPQVLFCAVERDGAAIIPGGDFVIRPGDKVHVAADILTITSFFRFLGKNTLRVRRVMILGGGRITFYLVKQILALGMEPTIIEIDKARARILAEQFPQANVLCGDGTDQELLDTENLEEMDAFVALTDRDEENLMASFYAQKRGVGRVVVKINRENYSGMIAAMGLDCIVTPKQLACNTMLRYVRGRSNTKGAGVERMYNIVNTPAETIELSVDADAPYLGVPLRNLQVTSDTLLAVIVRAGRVIVPFGNDYVQMGDSVILITKKSGLQDLSEVLHVRGGKA